MCCTFLSDMVEYGSGDKISKVLVGTLGDFVAFFTSNFNYRIINSYPISCLLDNNYRLYNELKTSVVTPIFLNKIVTSEYKK